MNGLYLEMEYLDGGSAAEDRLLFVDCTKSFRSPANVLECRFAADAALPDIRRVTLRKDGALLFRGECDRQQFLRERSGSLLSLLARSAGALPLENEAWPAVYHSLRLSQAFSTFLGGYPLGELEDHLLGGEDPVLPNFTVSKGISDWEAFKTYCQRATRLDPFLDDEDNVILGERPVLQLHQVGGEGEPPCLKADAQTNRCQVVSELYIRDETGAYSDRQTASRNQAVAYPRRRFLIPSGNWQQETYHEAVYRLKQSMRGVYTVEVTLAGLQTIRVGDYLNITLPGAYYEDMFVEEVRYTADEEGLMTHLKTFRSVFV